MKVSERPIKPSVTFLLLLLLLLMRGSTTQHGPRSSSCSTALCLCSAAKLDDVRLKATSRQEALLQFRISEDD